MQDQVTFVQAGLAKVNITQPLATSRLTSSKIGPSLNGSPVSVRPRTLCSLLNLNALDSFAEGEEDVVRLENLVENERSLSMLQSRV